jgi:dihydrolipoamide dehydrogenase
VPIQADLCVIGSGPGGYICAIRAARLGLSAVVVEADRLGGVCTNTGCIPTKAMLRSAEVFHLAGDAASYGVRVTDVEADFPAMMKRKDRVTASLSRGIGALLKDAGVQVVSGWGRLAGPNTVQVETVEGTETITAGSIVLATGSSAAVPPVPGLDGDGVITSDGALALEEVPGSMVIVGAGAVGVEWASLFATLGATVTVVEMLDRMVPVEDAEISALLRKSFLGRGVGLHLGAAVQNVSGPAGSMRVEIKKADGATETLESEIVLNATGRTPNSGELGLETIGVSTQRGAIQVDDRLRTNIPNIYAIGDVTGNAMLAHVASHQGVVVAENIAGGDSRMDYRTIPAATFCHPEIASVGLTEEQAVAEHGGAVMGRFSYMASGRARTYGDTEGLLKLVAEPKYQALVGMHIIGTSASEMIAEGVLAIKLEATLDDLRDVVHAHPTFPELTGEAAWEAVGQPLNTFARKT